MTTHRLWTTPIDHLRRTRPDTAMLYLSPATLQHTARRFLTGFPGQVTYAVKANPDAAVLANLLTAGVTAFDVASPTEMLTIRRLAPKAALHYNNPVRSPQEVALAARLGVASASVDDPDELEKLSPLPRTTEIAVRLALPIPGAAYDFGAKFGAPPDLAITLLREVAKRGHPPAICFHPGTQCADPAAWAQYIQAAADVAETAGVRLRRLNVGGGFASHRAASAPDLEAIFTRIKAETKAAFGPHPSALYCEPGRAMVAEAMTLATRVKAIRQTAVYLNDGLYGALAEARDIGAPARLRIIAPDGTPRRGPPTPRTVFGPTCDSLDRLPGDIALPNDLAPGDYVLFDGMGAYSSCIATRFNGYGPAGPITVARLA